MKSFSRFSLAALVAVVLSMFAAGAYAAGFDPVSLVGPDALAALAALGPALMVGDTTVRVPEQIKAFEQKRAATVARMAAIMEKANADGRTLDAAEGEEHDTLQAEIDAIDAHLKRLADLQKRLVATAAPVAPQTRVPDAGGSSVEVPKGVVTVTPNVDKGIAFTRYVKALFRANFNPDLAVMFAEKQASWSEQTPQVLDALRQKANVTANSAGSSGGGSQLVYNANLTGEFIELVRPLTILGRVPGLRRVPFNIRVGAQSTGSTGYWVGEGKPIPVSRLGTSEVTLGMAKAAGLLVTTKELMMSSSPSAEMLLRDDLVKTNVTFIDQQFIQPDYAAVANVNPASITNGVAPTAATGTALTNLKTDVKTLIDSFITNSVPVQGLVWVIHPSLALAFSMMENAVGQRQFPGMTIQGGEFFGLPCIASESAMQAGSPVSGEGKLLVLFNANEILLADEGEVDVEASTEASIQMLDNPTNDVTTPTATTMVSMFQTASVAVRAIRAINWAKRRSNVVAYIKDAAYTPT